MNYRRKELKKLSQIVLSCLLHTAVAAASEAVAASEVEIESIGLSASAAGAAVPSLLSGGAVSALPEAEFVKLSFVFKNLTKITKVSIESCTSDFSDGAEFHFSPGYRSSFAEAGHRKVEGRVIDPTHTVQAVSIVFRHNKKLCLKSLRVFGIKNEPLVLVLSDESKNIRHNNFSRKPFEEAQTAAVLDREIKTDNENLNWLVRLRSDQTFFIRGHSDQFGMPSQFVSSGIFEVIAARERAVKLRLLGSRYSAPGLWDGTFCTKCVATIAKQGVKLDEEIEVEKIRGSSAYMVRNRTIEKARLLPFSDLRMTVSTLDE